MSEFKKNNLEISGYYASVGLEEDVDAPDIFAGVPLRSGDTGRGRCVEWDDRIRSTGKIFPSEEKFLLS